MGQGGGGGGIVDEAIAATKAAATRKSKLVHQRPRFNWADVAGTGHHAGGGGSAFRARRVHIIFNVYANISLFGTVLGVENPVLAESDSASTGFSTPNTVPKRLMFYSHGTHNQRAR